MVDKPTKTSAKESLLYADKNCMPCSKTAEKAKEKL